MDLIVETPHLALWNKRQLRCAVGRGGIVSAAQKHEGDGATPAGCWAMREVLYRTDRIAMPSLRLKHRAMNPQDGWCEIPDDPQYNKLVRHPYAVPVDHLWREDHLYDIVVVLGYNDDPVVPGKGSAIFMHLARPDFSPSAGCVTLAREDLLDVLREADAQSCVVVKSRP
ncbi:MAG: L,D-transpeptidase family protein [Alphaproteobacteria bacterium]|nr:L,D-transpeptidase family protein [Alphaproteobacteria bacterium]